MFKWKAIECTFKYNWTKKLLKKNVISKLNIMSSVVCKVILLLRKTSSLKRRTASKILLLIKLQECAEQYIFSTSPTTIFKENNICYLNNENSN